MNIKKFPLKLLAISDEMMHNKKTGIIPVLKVLFKTKRVEKKLTKYLQDSCKYL